MPRLPLFRDIEIRATGTYEKIDLHGRPVPFAGTSPGDVYNIVEDAKGWQSLVANRYQRFFEEGDVVRVQSRYALRRLGS